MNTLIYLLMFLPDIFDNIFVDGFNPNNFHKLLEQKSFDTKLVKRLRSTFSNNESLRIKSDEVKENIEKLINDKSDLVNKLDSYTREALYQIQNLPKDSFFSRVKAALNNNLNLAALFTPANKFNNDNFKQQVGNNIKNLEGKIKNIDNAINNETKSLDDYREGLFKLGPRAYNKFKTSRLNVQNIRKEKDEKDNI